MKKGEDGFLSRWSAKKRGLVEDEALPEATDIDSAAPAIEAEAEKTEAEVLEELGLKDPDQMEKGDDFSAFMKSGIPAALKKRALRKLWLSNPMLACVDGLNDYDGDFTSATAVTDFKTAYQVGKGFARRVLDVLDDAENPDLPVESVAEVTDEPVLPEPVEAPDETLQVEATTVEPDMGRSGKRRMAFVFPSEVSRR